MAARRRGRRNRSRRLRVSGAPVDAAPPARRTALLADVGASDLHRPLRQRAAPDAPWRSPARVDCSALARCPARRRRAVDRRRTPVRRGAARRGDRIHSAVGAIASEHRPHGARASLVRPRGDRSHDRGRPASSGGRRCPSQPPGDATRIDGGIRRLRREGHRRIAIHVDCAAPLVRHARRADRRVLARDARSWDRPAGVGCGSNPLPDTSGDRDAGSASERGHLSTLRGSGLDPLRRERARGGGLLDPCLRNPHAAALARRLRRACAHVVANRRGGAPWRASPRADQHVAGMRYGTSLAPFTCVGGAL
jgi:hypothetical protein